MERKHQGIITFEDRRERQTGKGGWGGKRGRKEGKRGQREGGRKERIK